MNRSRVATAALTVLLVAGLLASCAGTVDPVSVARSSQRGPTPVTILGVAFHRKGQVVRSTDAGISGHKVSQGIYVVRFPIKVRNCIYGISIADDNATGVPPEGFVTAGARSRHPTDLFVTTKNRRGRFAGRPFHLTVTCRA